MNRNLPCNISILLSVFIAVIYGLLPVVGTAQTFPFHLPELPAGKKVTIFYNVVVNDPLVPPTTTVIGEHDTVFYAPGHFLLSDDPDTGAPDDITLTPAAQFACNSFDGVVYVDSSATGGNNDGTSWTDAFTDLQDALLARVICTANVDTILVAQGTYYPTPDAMDRDSSFNIPDGVVVLGGFLSGGGTLDERSWECYESILSGDIDQDGSLSGNSLHVVRTENVNSSTVVDGFTIAGGNAIGGSLPDQAGGGWYNDGTGAGNVSNPTIRNCAFVENSTSNFGGAMFNNGLSGESSPILINCVFSGNESLVSGGAIFNQGVFGESSPEIINCVFSGNTAVNGGAVFNNGAAGISSPEIINCVFSGNNADDGGAMYNLGSGGSSTPSNVNTIFYNNAASNGPVFYNEDASPSIQYSLFDIDFATVNHNGSVTDNGNNKFSMDPLFMKAPPASAAPTTAGNFRVMSGSPAIDMGDNGANSESEDLDGLSRVYNGIIDMGAYEWRPYCRQDTVYLDENGEGIVVLDSLIGELPDFQGCELDTIIDVPTVSCDDTAVLYNLYLIRDMNSAMPDTIIQCTDTIWVRDTMAPVIDMINMELAVNEDCMAVMPDLSIYVSDNCALDTVIQSPEVGDPLGPPGSMVMVTLYARDSSGNESSVMFDFEVVEVAPTVPLNCAGIISPAINPDGTINVLVIEIAPNATCLPVHDVQVLNEWDKVIWSGDDLRNNDFILAGFNLCSYLGKTLDVEITNGLGTCTTVLNLSKLASLVMTSGLQPGNDPAIAEGKINVYCGKVPDPSKYTPTVLDICTGRSYSPQVQPDWVMPIPCDEESDTAEIIFRTWEVYDKEGNLSTLTDTIVVFRLPKLTPGAFVGTAEDSFYCELEPVPLEGNALKRYASWKQPLGLHDYELPYAKLRGVTYEIPGTIIIAGLVNAFAQGPNVLEEYLDCVILRKADGTEVTIEDIVTGDYMADLIANATPTQLGYGFLQLLIEGNEKPLNVVLNIALEFYPYLLLQEGDWILSEGGNFEQVDADWFYNGNGNAPYWFSGGWPSIYGSGDCISYCDVGEGKDFGCIRIQIPLLDTTGFNPELCDTICLPTGVHCGITIEQDDIADPDGQAWTGSCPQTRGVDSWITQTCWAETPNFCDENFTFYAALCRDGGAGGNGAPQTSQIAISGTRTRIDLPEFAPEIVEAYECSDKAIKIHISQWQTLYDTIGPIFDFCYPVGFSENDINCKGKLCLLETEWDHDEIQDSIRAGGQYLPAERWEFCNPTIYRVGTHDCEAEVYVPSVKVIDNCSGVNSVKAMVEVKGGTRAIALEKTATEMKILAKGDTCWIHTYSHTTDPFTLPFSGCDARPIEVRYEAADNCWNQSTWSKYVKITDDVPPTVVTDRAVTVPLQNKIAWVHAETFDEGSWDNCAIDLRLVRRTDWWADTACVDLCSDLGSKAPYDNWVDLLDDLGVDRNQAVAAVGGGVICEDDFDTEYKVEDLKTFLNEGEVEEYYYNQIVWLWEDGQLCGRKAVHGWLFSITQYIAENCSATDEHGNKLDVKDLAAIFDRLTGIPGYGKELSLLGGGWGKSVPFKCEDACLRNEASAKLGEVTVELLVMDYCCNWGKGWATAHVEDKSNAKLVKRLPDLDITCEAYSSFYKDIVENAAALGENGSDQDTSGVFAALDAALGHYVKGWVLPLTPSEGGQIRATDIDGNLLPDSVLNFDFWNVNCEEKSETEKVAVENHDGTVDWVNRVTKMTYMDTTTHTGMNGIIGINCAASCIQDVWVDLDECGQGIITRRFTIRGGCGPTHRQAQGPPEWTVEQVINVASACGMRESMFDLPASAGTKDAPVCLPQALSDDYLPDTIGAVTLKPHLEGALCNSVAIGTDVQEFNVETLDPVSQDLDMKKYIITWTVIDWCAPHTSTNRAFTYTQEVIATIDPDCNVDVSVDTSGDVSLVNGVIKTELGSPVRGVEVKAVLGQGSPLNVETAGSGDYNFTIADGSQVSIMPRKNTGHSNGVSTGDLIDIQRHVLQKKALDSKYKRIAADVNGNGRIEGLDVLELRKLVLNPSGVFANNTSWRFYDTVTDKEVYEINPLEKDMTVNFTGVKIGDVNLSGDPARSSRTANGQVHLNIADKVLKGGEVYRVEVRSDNFDDIRGMQYTLGYADAYVSVESIEPGVLNITPDHYLKYAPGVITASWNEADGVSVGADEVLFTIVLKAKSAAVLRNVLSLSDRITPTEAYNASGELKDVALHFNGMDSGFALYQNTPNPYQGETVIGFKLPAATAATMTIYDVTGRMIKRIEGEYEAGYNEVRVTSRDLGTTGVLYYQLDTDEFTATKKMIIVDY